LYFLHLSNHDIGARAITLAFNWVPFQCSKINKYEDHFFQCSLCHTIILLLTKLVWSRWLDIGLVSFCVFMDLDFVSVHKNAKIELGQYPAILTSRLVNNIYIYNTITSRVKSKSKLSLSRRLATADLCLVSLLLYIYIKLYIIISTTSKQKQVNNNYSKWFTLRSFSHL